MSKPRKKFLCLDCGIDTGKIGEHYMLIDSVWYQVHTSNKGMLCIGCLEIRLRRKLTKLDFNTSHVNAILPAKIYSARLLNRMGKQ